MFIEIYILCCNNSAVLDLVYLPDKSTRAEDRRLDRCSRSLQHQAGEPQLENVATTRENNNKTMCSSYPQPWNNARLEI